ncbi:MAG: hypothetical protein HY973_03030 [Candidatus Kerfeldbacteria bacterium]|nr:hypothetical protein [Candidatus Kerfeldbacteria bacterium]
MSSLELAIIKTLTWFDLFNQPLTTWEVWFYLWDESGNLGKVNQSDILLVLEKLAADNLITGNLGYWQLAASPNYVPERLQRLRWTINKRRRAKQAVRLIKHLPFIRLVGLVNTAAFDMAGRDSDIDFFIITESGRIFTARFLVTSLMQFLGWRRHSKLVSNRICLSFYLTDDNLNLQPLAYKDDPYLRFWLASLQVLYDDGVYSSLLAANSWLNRELPNWPAVVTKERPAVRVTPLARSSILERVLEKFQMYLISRHQDSRLGDGSTAVLASRQILKFHESDVRQELAQRFRESLIKIIT